MALLKRPVNTRPATPSISASSGANPNALYPSVGLGFEFEKTYSIAYTLYAKSLISFPSLYQNTVPESVIREMEKNMRVLEHNGKWGRLAKEVKVSS